tara:strand:+ start:1125 stop:2276 length:1152 start_codon:yes stop_codon:yes gene_type:complete
MQKVYDLVLIGGGISSSTFIANILKEGFKGSIAVVEAGRGLGGRCSTRYNSRDKKLALNHGCPNFNLINSKKNSHLDDFIKTLIKNKLIKSLENSFFQIGDNYKFSNIYDNDFYFGNVYTSTSNMSKFVENIIHLYDSQNQIDFYFQTLVVKLNYKSDHWTILSNKNKKISGKFLVCSSNLLLHKRSLEILNVREIPLREALNEKNNIKIHEIIKLTNRQEYIKRINFLIYTKKNCKLEGIFNRDIIHFLFNKYVQDDIGFERIIFQKQLDNSLGIVIHTKNMELINKYESENNKILYQSISNKLNTFLIKNQISSKDLLLDDISRMNWRASQPIGEGIPERLQLCKECNIGFCGDWFQFEGFGSVQGAILSAIKLSKKFIEC